MYVKLPEPLLSDVTMAFIRPLVKVISSAVLPVLSLKKWIRDTENYSSRCLPQTLSIFTLANMVLSFLIVMKPALPVSLSFI